MEKPEINLDPKFKEFVKGKLQGVAVVVAVLIAVVILAWLAPDVLESMGKGLFGVFNR